MVVNCKNCGIAFTPNRTPYASFRSPNSYICSKDCRILFSSSPIKHSGFWLGNAHRNRLTYEYLYSYYMGIPYQAGKS